MLVLVESAKLSIECQIERRRYKTSYADGTRQVMQTVQDQLCRRYKTSYADGTRPVMKDDNVIKNNRENSNSESTQQNCLRTTRESERVRVRVRVRVKVRVRVRERQKDSQSVRQSDRHTHRTERECVCVCVCACVCVCERERERERRPCRLSHLYSPT